MTPVGAGLDQGIRLFVIEFPISSRQRGYISVCKMNLLHRVKLRYVSNHDQ
jgi:hypothetical protein